ncbi:MAG: EF-P beta-lysylation protein EpmB [Candidatus Accumulibacter sp.]|nr:EF-P beta-lysylation protein EpmB [Accumulibacter sp.]
MVARNPAQWQGQNTAGEPWQQALQTVISDGHELLRRLGIDPQALPIDHEQPFPLRVPRAFVARMQAARADDPLLRQVLPLLAEATQQPGFSRDPLAEAAAEPVPGLIHKYHGRVLLIVTGHCAIHCRYCFRRHFPYAARQPSRAEWSRAFDYIRHDASISEVILSGGDPLSAADRHLAWLIGEIEAIPQVSRLRIHSRLPVVIPTRITAALSALLADSRLLVSLVIHANHARELDDSLAAALAPLRRAGVTLLNQSVLLAGVNDQVEVLSELSERLFAIGVLPYYLHLLDHVAGAAHFAVPEERVQVLQAALLARLPGYLVPRLVREVAHAASKMPVFPPVRP